MSEPNLSPTVQVASCTVSQLLDKKGALPDWCQGGGSHKLAIPEYQRPYRWGKRQITRLLDDIAAHNKREGERLDVLREAKLPAVRVPYYLGSVILHRDDEGTLNIIDGQQRITSLALLAQVFESGLQCGLVYLSPVSRQQIVENLQWLNGLGEELKGGIKKLCFEHLEFTLVITNSEDDAYAFFETQNTGGVRLSGPDIIKAHHLRAVPSSTVDDFALRWEALGDLNPVVAALLRGRFWRSVDFRTYPSHNQAVAIRTSIVSELAERTGTGDDIAHARITRTRELDGAESVHTPIVGYALRQPLNSGANSIHYLQFFEALRRQYLVGPMPAKAKSNEFPYFYHELLCKLGGCAYLKQLFDACLLMYLSQFGEQRLYAAAVKIFRVVYSRRVENRKAVRELSVVAFVRDTPVLDWIALSYTPEQCLATFDGFELNVSGDGLEDGQNGVKKRFVRSVQWYFSDDVQANVVTEKKDDATAVDGQAFGQCFSEKVRAL